MPEGVPFVDLAAQQAEILDDIRPEVERILRTAAFIGGEAVGQFEREYAELTGVAHCIGVANGTDAIELALRALGVGAGDEVILPANSFIATAEAVVRAGASPVLVDVDDETLLIDPARVADALTRRTRAVIPVHLFGQTAPVEEIAALVAGTDVSVVEDAAQSQGASRHGIGAGALGRIASTSFYPGKNLGAAGDAGAVTTDDTDLADRVRLLGAHGSEKKYVHDVLGFNSRLDSLQAVVLRSKLAYLPRWNELRRQAAARYEELLAPLPVRRPVVAPGNVPVWHLYVVRVANRDLVHEQLMAAGVQTGIHYPTPIHQTGAFAHLGHRAGAFPVSEEAASQILSLPMFPHITRGQQERVTETLRSVTG